MKIKKKHKHIVFKYISSLCLPNVPMKWVDQQVSVPSCISWIPNEILGLPFDVFPETGCLKSLSAILSFIYILLSTYWITR